MTIPIIPGPFSFLQNFGRAASEAGQFKQKQQQIDYEQASHTLSLIMQGIRDKTIKPEMLDSPMFENALEKIGFKPTNVMPGGEKIAGVPHFPSMVEPSPELLQSRARYGMLKDMIPSLNPMQQEEFAATGSIVPQSTLGAKRAGEAASTAESGFKEATARGATPRAGEAAAVNQAGDIEKVRDALADELLGQAAAQAGVTKANQMNYALIQRAYTAGLQDPKFQGIDPAILSAAYTRLMLKLRAIEASELSAAARFQASTGSQDATNLRTEQDQLDAIRAEYNNLLSNPPDMGQIILEAMSTNPQDKDAWKGLYASRVGEWNARKTQLEGLLTQGNEALNTKLSGRTGLPTVLPPGATPGAQPPRGAPTTLPRQEQPSSAAKIQLQPADMERAKNDPKFAEWLRKKGYQVP